SLNDGLYNQQTAKILSFIEEPLNSYGSNYCYVLGGALATAYVCTPRQSMMQLSPSLQTFKKATVSLFEQGPLQPIVPELLPKLYLLLPAFLAHKLGLKSYSCLTGAVEDVLMQISLILIYFIIVSYLNYLITPGGSISWKFLINKKDLPYNCKKLSALKTESCTTVLSKRWKAEIQILPHPLRKSVTYFSGNYSKPYYSLVTHAHEMQLLRIGRIHYRIEIVFPLNKKQ
ncbi:Hypothetical predicted protein, partial [Pelobates cultripes]